MGSNRNAIQDNFTRALGEKTSSETIRDQTSLSSIDRIAWRGGGMESLPTGMARETGEDIPALGCTTGKMGREVASKAPPRQTSPAGRSSLWMETT